MFVLKIHLHYSDLKADRWDRYKSDFFFFEGICFLHINCMKQFCKMNLPRTVKAKDLWGNWGLQELCKNFPKMEIAVGEWKILWNLFAPNHCFYVYLYIKHIGGFIDEKAF